MRKHKSLIARMGAVVILAGGMVALSSVDSEAAFYAWICDDSSCLAGGDTVVLDQGAGDTALLPGTIQMSALFVNGISITTQTSIAKPPSGNPLLNLTFTATCDAATFNCAGGNVWLYASHIGYTPPSLSATFNGTAGVSQEAFVYGGNANTNTTGALPSPDLSNLLGGTGNINGAVYNVPFAPAAPSVSPYALTAGVRLTLTADTSASGDLSIIPEPASTALFGLGLFGAAVMTRRRLRQQQQ